MEALNPIPPGREHWITSPEAAAAEWVGGYRGTTRANYGRELRAWLWWCQDSQLDAWLVSRVHIEQYLGRMPARRARSVATVICGFYRDAHGRGLTATDLAWGVRRPKVGRGPAGTFATPDELRKLLVALDSLDDADVQAVLSVLILTGFRLTETLALNCTECAVKGDTVRVTLYRKHSHIDVLPLPGIAGQRVKALLEKRKTGAVFRREGKRLDANTVRRHLTLLADEVGCEQKITPHSLRRSFVTFARDLGLGDADIMAMTGHQDASMIDYYDRGRRQRDGVAGHAVATALAKFDG